MTSAGSVNLILSSNFCGESSLHKYPGVQSFDVNISRQLKFFTLFHFNRFDAVSIYIRKMDHYGLAIFKKSVIYGSSLIVGMHVLRTFYKLGKIILEPRGGGC